MRSERHKTSMTSTTYEEMSLIDSSVIMIFLVLPISTHDYCNRGMQHGSAIQASTLENPQTWFPHVDAMRLNTSYHVMTPVPLCSTNADTSTPEPILS